MRIGIFGGSFDPVHYGHLLLAECCREAARLDSVWFVPAAESPHKRAQMQASGKDRTEMLRLAIGGTQGLEVSTVELDRGGVSYTVDTLRALRAAEPAAEFFLLMGGDTLADFPKWREPAAILALATPLVVTRRGAPLPNVEALAGLLGPAQRAAIEQFHVSMPVIELSSTELRQRAAAGKSLRFRTPRAVEMYIQTHHLYRTHEA